jgi:hypothetical protein
MEQHLETQLLRKRCESSTGPESIITPIFGGEFMKILVNIVGGIIFLGGLVFFLQGINVLPGSYMTGDPKWAMIGAVMMVVGVGSFVFTSRRK